jgi:hypothetical protein
MHGGTLVIFDILAHFRRLFLARFVLLLLLIELLIRRKRGGEKMAEEIRNASDMIQNFLRQQPRAVSVSILRETLPISFTVMVMALDSLASEDKLNIEVSSDQHSRRIYLKR